MGKLKNIVTKNKEEKLRFVLVGGTNTAIDFGLLFILKALGLPVLVANIISTGLAFCFSFFMNKKYTFKTSGTDVKREVFWFVVVTLFGLWVIQPIIIWFTGSLLSPVLHNDNWVLLLGKLLATCFTLVWNYVLYAKLVFIKKADDNQ